MRLEILTTKDVTNYLDDIIECYRHNKLVFDSQSYFKDLHPIKITNFVSSYINNNDNVVYGIFNNDKEFLYGLIFLTNNRFSQGQSSSEVHIVTNKILWGKTIKNIYSDLLAQLPFTVLYCHIPSIAINAIRMCKTMGFKKTGYIPNAIPYINSKGIEQMYDIQIWVFKRD